MTFHWSFPLFSLLRTKAHLCSHSLPHFCILCFEGSLKAISFIVVSFAHAVKGTHFKCTIRLGVFKDFIYLFLERGREGDREGEKHQCVVAFHTPPTGDLACKPVMCPDWESNQSLFGSQTSTQSTEPHQPGQFSKSLYKSTIPYSNSVMT